MGGITQGECVTVVTYHAVVLGEPLDESRHRVRTAVKAVTWHELSVAQDPQGLRARVILDL